MQLLIVSVVYLNQYKKSNFFIGQFKTYNILKVISSLIKKQNFAYRCTIRFTNKKTSYPFVTNSKISKVIAKKWLQNYQRNWIALHFYVFQMVLVSPKKQAQF